MSLHIRSEIRRAVQTRLTDATMAGANVYNGLTRSLNTADAAAITLLTAEESAAPRERGPGAARRRDIALTVELFLVMAEGESDQDFFERLDTFASEVEAAIDADPTLGGVVAAAILETTSFDGIDTQFAVPMGVMTLGFGVTTNGDAASLQSGLLSVVRAGGLVVGRVRDWSLEAAGDPPDTTGSQSTWRNVNERFAPGWSATLLMTLDDGDPAQAALAMKSAHDFEFWPRGENVGRGRAGRGVVSSVEEAVDADGDVVRTVTITGSGPLGNGPSA